MKQLFFTPGPSALYFTVEQHIKNALNEQIGAISHRSNTFTQLYSHTESMLRQLLHIPDDFHVLFLSSATEIWERIIQNCVMHESTHYTYGAFSERFYQTALDYHKKAQKLVYQEQEGPQFNPVDWSKKTELIALTQNETSTGLSVPDIELHALRDLTTAQIAVDAVSGLPYYQADFTSIDHLYFSVQKGFGLPAGLGVWIVSPKAVAAYRQIKESGHSTGSYHDLGELIEKAEKKQTPETPNVFSIYLLGKVAEDMLNKGMKQILNETIYKSTVLYEAIKQSPYLKPYIEAEKNQSKTVIVTETPYATEIIQVLKAKGMVIGSGYGKNKNSHIRIANFPAHSKEQIELLADYLLDLRL
jgi:phosphoserine aminotransferase